MAVFFVPLKDLLAVLLMNMNVLKVLFDSIPSLIEKNVLASSDGPTYNIMVKNRNIALVLSIVMWHSSLVSSVALVSSVIIRQHYSTGTSSLHLSDDMNIIFSSIRQQIHWIVINMVCSKVWRLKAWQVDFSPPLDRYS